MSYFIPCAFDSKFVLKKTISLKSKKTKNYKHFYCCSNSENSFPWEGWKLSRQFRLFLRKTGHFPLQRKRSGAFPQPDNILKLPPAKTTTEEEFERVSREVRFKQNYETQQHPVNERPLVSITGQGAILYGELIQTFQEGTKAWVRPLILMQEEFSAFPLAAAESLHKNYYNMSSLQDILLPSHLVQPYHNELSSLLNILQETSSPKSSQEREQAIQAILAFLRGLYR
eukprot:jgi/Galph1/3247/GphlegSOOS_G1897.1